ncbi:MAG TPA: GNAT family N-acetyltransferase [Bacteroidetes bacterium]|nr:GNAT family N-acetyltransferase [Bacteroidota bacterium]
MPVRLRPLSAVRSDALALWEQAAVRTPFAHPGYAEAVGRVFGLAPVAALADGAGVIGWEKRRGPIRALALPPATPYVAPLVAEWPREAEIVRQRTALGGLARDLAGDVQQATLALPPDWRDARPFAWAGWRLETRYTAVADPSGDPLARWSHGTRQRARRHADTYQLREGSAEIAHAASFQVQSYERKSLALGISADTLATLGETLVELGLARAFGAYRDGACEAAALFAVDGPRAIYWLSGSEPGPAMSVLFLHAMTALAADGVTTLDLGGANVPGVAQFKRQLGGELAPVVVARWVGPRWLRAAQSFRG